MKSFAEVVGGGMEKVSIQRKRAVERNGETIISFSVEEIKRSIEPFKWALVGRFGRYRPNVDEVRKAINTSWGLKSNVSIGILDSRHILLRCGNEEDFMKMWTKESPAIKGVKLILFPWTIDFDPSHEVYKQPVWIRFPNLPINLFQEDFIASIASGVGKFIKMDNTTQWLARPEVARVCVELDIRKKLCMEITIELGNIRRKQKIIYETIPQGYLDFHDSMRHMQKPPTQFTKGSEQTLKPLLLNSTQRLTETEMEAPSGSRPTQGEKRKPQESTKEWAMRVFYPKTKAKVRKIWRKKIIQKNNVGGIANASINFIREGGSMGVERFNSVGKMLKTVETHVGTVKGVGEDFNNQENSVLNVTMNRQEDNQVNDSTIVQTIEFPGTNNTDEQVLSFNLAGNSEIERSDKVSRAEHNPLVSSKLVNGPSTLECPTCIQVQGQIPSGSPTCVRVKGHGEKEITTRLLVSGMGMNQEECSVVKGLFPLESPTCVQVQGQAQSGRPTCVQVQGLGDMERPTRLQVQDDGVVGIKEGADQGVQFNEGISVGVVGGSAVMEQGQSTMEESYANDDMILQHTDVIIKGYASDGDKKKSKLQVGINRTSLRSSKKCILKNQF